MNKNLLIFFLILSAIIYGQDSTGSLAFKKNRPVKKNTLFYQPDLSYRIWQQFNLVQEANSGNSLAQHELGLRYLLGEDQPADTIKAAYWIKKAALQKLPAAAFNYGILLFNGWGVEWNPFEAYKNFQLASNDGMAPADYIIGLLHTDNLVLKKDWKKAYFYLKRSADKGHKPAVDIIEEIRKQLPPDFDTTGTAIPETAEDNFTSPGLVFIDFDKPVTSKTSEITDSLLFDDLLLSGNKKFEKIIAVKNGQKEISFDKQDLAALDEAAEYGCPEALTLIGRLYEEGIYYPVNRITAASYFIRGAKLDSYRSTVKLYELAKDDSFMSKLKDAALNDQPEAMFVWYGLYDFNLDNSITGKDAVDLLIKCAERNYIPAQVELGLITYTGKYAVKNVARALEIWRSIQGGTNKEAEIREAASVVYEETGGDINSAAEIIIRANDKGSILAQVVLGYLYEKKLIVSKNSGEDIKYYRNAAHRGNRFAIAQLERRYNELRPPDPEFQLKN